MSFKQGLILGVVFLVIALAGSAGISYRVAQGVGVEGPQGEQGVQGEQGLQGENEAHAANKAPEVSKGRPGRMRSRTAGWRPSSLS